MSNQNRDQNEAPSPHSDEAKNVSEPVPQTTPLPIEEEAPYPECLVPPAFIGLTEGLATPKAKVIVTLVLCGAAGEVRTDYETRLYTKGAISRAMIRTAGADAVDAAFSNLQVVQTTDLEDSPLSLRNDTN